VKTSHCIAALCLSAGLATTAYAQTGSGQSMGQQQQPQMGQQQQQLGGRLTEQRVRQFFSDAQRALQQATRSQDPLAFRQYMSQFMADDANITSASELFLGDRHVATTISHSNEEAVQEALGHAASALQGRRMVSDYNVEIRVRDIQLLPGQQQARVTAVIQESGIFGGPLARRVAERVRERMGSMMQQRDQMMGRGGQGMGQDSSSQGMMSQQDDDDSMDQRGMIQRGLGGGMGSGSGSGPGRGGAPEQGIHFQSRSTCTMDVGADQGQIRIGNTFCRGTMRLG
jgi:hypothetical protein